jgi:hypothetical protein
MATDHRVIRLHWRIALAPPGTTKRLRIGATGQQVHLQQSDLDSACGPHCVITALCHLGILSGIDLQTMTDGKSRGRHQRFWRLVRHYYFSGTTSGSLRRMLEPLSSEVVVTTTRAVGMQAVEFALAQLNAERLVLLRIANWRAGFDHWVLAVGVEGREQGGKFNAEHLLILDPSRPAIPLAAWNGLLAVDKARGKRTHQVTDQYGDNYQVALIAALAIGRK